MTEINYRDHTNIANSDLGLFKKLGPAKYNYTKNNSVNKKTKAKDFGSLIHTLFLEEQRFNEEYTYLPIKVPDGMVSEFVRLKALYVSNGYDILDAELKAYSEVDFSYKLDTVITKSQTPLYYEYYDFLLKNKDKNIVSKSDYDKAKSMFEKFKNSRYFDFFNEADVTFIETPYYYNMNLKNGVLPAKILPDKVNIINKKDETIVRIFDIKSAEDLHNFETTNYIKYRYHRQLAYYGKGIAHYLINTQLLFDFKIEYYILVVETEEPYSIELMQISDEDIQQGLVEIEEIASELIQHLNSGIWEKIEGNNSVRKLNFFKPK